MASKPFIHTERFFGHLGLFHAIWSATELNIHLTIGKILKLTPEQTHALVAGMMFGRKAALLRSLLPKSDYKNVSELKEFLTHIKKSALRNVFTHSLIFSSPDGVTFVHRSSQDGYSAKGYSFKADDFCGHVIAFVKLAKEFDKALAIPPDELEQFARAALPPKSK